MRKYIIKQNITDGKQEEVLQAEEILEDKIIDKKIIAKIRQRYSIDQECEMLRLGILDVNNVEFQSYNSFVKTCLNWGSEKKVKASEEKEYWKDKYRQRNETEKEFISRLKIVKPIVVEPIEPIIEK